MANIIKTVGAGHAAPDYATLSLWNAGEGSVDPGVGFFNIADCSGDCGSGAAINGSHVRGYKIIGGVVFDGTNQSSLASCARISLNTDNGLIQHFKVTNTNGFDNALGIFGANTYAEDVYVEDSSTSSASYGAVNLRGMSANKGIKRFVINASSAVLIRTGFDSPMIITNGVGFGATTRGILASGSNQELTDCFFFDCNSNAFSGAFDVESNLASDDATATHTPYDSAELVDFAGSNYQTKSTSFLATAGSPFVGAFLEASSGITLDVTESYDEFTESAVGNVTSSSDGVKFVASVNTTKPANPTMTVTLPTHSEGDVIVLSFVHDYNSNTQFLTAVSEGYTELATLNIQGLNHQGAVWYKKAGASEVNPTATYSASSQEMACLAASYSGVDTVTQIDVGPSVWNTEDPGDTDVDAPSVTTTLDGAMLINVATADENDTYTQPSGMTLVDNLVFRNMVVASAYQEIPTAGATGAKTWVFSQNTDEITAVSFALRPLAAGVNITATESYDKFTEDAVVDVTPDVNVTSIVTESYSNFSESVVVDVSANIQSAITESYDDFSESINVTSSVNIEVLTSVTESYSAFTETVNANVSKDFSLTVTEAYEDFSESVSTLIDRGVSLGVTESYDDFSESVTARISVIITVNPKNIVRVKRKNNNVIIKRKSNILRVK